MICNSCSVCVKVIEKYLQSTHASTHSDYTMSVLDIFKLDREGEHDSFQQLHNRYYESADALGHCVALIIIFIPVVALRCHSANCWLCVRHQDSTVARFPPFQLGWDPQSGAAYRSARSSRHWLHGRVDPPLLCAALYCFLLQSKIQKSEILNLLYIW